MQDPPFAPRDEPNGVDLLLLFILPTTLLITIFLYPESEQILEYKARDPTALTIIGSNLAHRGPLHIVGNLLGLWLIGGMGFIFACASQRKRLYYYAFATYITILPFFADSLKRGMLEDIPQGLATYETAGFSLTVGALVGFLAIAMGLFLRENVDDQIWGLSASFGLFISGFSIIVVTVGGDTHAFALSIATGIFVIGYVLWRGNQAEDGPIYHIEGIQFFGAALFIFYASLLLLFPPDVGGSFFGHIAGYVWGFLLPAFGLFTVHLYCFISGHKNNRLRVAREDS